MKKLLLLPLLGLFALPLLSNHSETSPALNLEAKAFNIDLGHSAVIFRIKHLDASWFYGRFADFSGSFNLDKDDPSASSVELEVKADSVDTFDEGRDKHVKSPDFFSVRQFPKITFKSTSVKGKDNNEFEVTGMLNFRGVEKEVTFMAEMVGQSNKGERFGERAGLHAELSIKRTDFGNSTYVNESVLGDEVGLIISLEGMAK